MAPIQSIIGWIFTKLKALRGSKATNKVALAGGIFDRKEEVVDTLRQAPEIVLAQSEVAASRPANRWKLSTLRAALPWLHHYSLSGVWRLLQRYDLTLRMARIQQYSPDPDYDQKEAHLVDCLHQTAQNPHHFVFLFLDEMGY